MFELSDIKTLKALRLAVNTVKTKMKDWLDTSDLNNKQKTEIVLAAQLEAYAIIDSLLNSYGK